MLIKTEKSEVPYKETITKLYGAISMENVNMEIVFNSSVYHSCYA